MTEQQPALPFDPVALANAMSEAGRKYFEEMRAFVLAATEAFRPLIEYLQAHPELADWEPEPDPPACHHLCGRTSEHECTGEATTTLTVVKANDFGHEIPMCQACWAAALDARAVATITAAERALAE